MTPAAASLPPPAFDPHEPWTPWHRLVAVALAGLGLFLPFSTAGTSIFLAAALALALARPRALWAAQPWRDPVMATGLALLAYIGLHTLWSSGWQKETLQTINRYHELLALPLLLFLLGNARHRRMFFGAVLAGGIGLAIAHWLAPLSASLSQGLVPKRISAGFALTVYAYVALAQADASRHPWVWRGLAAFLAATVLFRIDGRTGHVLLLLLAVGAAWLHSPRRYRLAAAVVAPLAVIALALGSPAIKSRLGETMAGSYAADPKADLTSTAIRIGLVQLAWDLSKEHYLTGAGFANYDQVQEQAGLKRFGASEAHVRAGWFRGANPHNEYAMQLVGGGLVSLGLFLAWLALTLRRAAVAARRPDAIMLGGVVVAFAIGSLVNSLLMDFIEGHVYMGLLALMLARIRHEVPAGAHPAPARILVVATRQIGDVLLTTPLVRALRVRWPQARIDVLGFAGTLGMLAGNEDVAQRIEVPARLGAGGAAALVRKLWRRYELALVTDAGDRAHLIAWLASSRRTGIVPGEGGSIWWKKLLLLHAVPSAGDRGDTHTVMEKLALLAPWQDVQGMPAPRVVPPPGIALPPDIDAQLQAGFVVVHAPSMWSYKQWPLEHFAAVVRRLLAQGRQVVLTGSGSARDRECIAPLRALEQPPRLLDVSGRLDFNHLTTLLSRASLYIGPDTSVSHLAAATGLPVLAVFGPTNPQRWAPWPASAAQPVQFLRTGLMQQAGNVTLLQSDKACVPCGRAGCEDHRQSTSECLPAITPERVLEQAERLLAGIREHQHA